MLERCGDEECGSAASAGEAGVEPAPPLLPLLLPVVVDKAL